MRHSSANGGQFVESIHCMSRQVCYEVRSRKDHRGFDLISDVLPFGRLWYGEPNAIKNAIRYAKFFSRSHHTVIRVYDEAGNSANVMAMATALGKIKIEPKNLTWQAVGALADDGEEDGSVWAQIG